MNEGGRAARGLRAEGRVRSGQRQRRRSDETLTWQIDRPREVAQAAFPAVAMVMPGLRQAKLRGVSALRHPCGKRYIGRRLRRPMREAQPQKGGQQQEEQKTAQHVPSITPHEDADNAAQGGIVQ